MPNGIDDNLSAGNGDVDGSHSIISPLDELGQKRLHAWRMQQSGQTYRDIASTLDVSASTVSKWIKLAREGGIEALRSNEYKQVLTVAQLLQLASDLDLGATQFGFPDDEWSAERFKWLVKYRFDVE